jgi:hypothetical protein
MTYRTLWSVGLLMVGHAVFGIEPIPAADKAKPTVIVSDVLTTPGQPVQLQTRVFEESLLGRKIGLGGETLEFLVGGQVVGTTMTGGDGRAFWEYAPRMRGNFTITVRVPESPRVLSAEGKGLLASWERKKPILLIDLVSVMQEKSNPELPLPSFSINFSPTDLGEPDDDAPKELEKLGRFYYNLVYLFRSEAGDKKSLQDWIRTHQFPSGFPKIIPSGRQALEELIVQLEKDGWANVTGGIGRTTEFAEVLVEHRLKAVILHDPEDNEEFPRRAILVKNWNRVRKHL